MGTTNRNLVGLEIQFNHTLGFLLHFCNGCHLKGANITQLPSKSKDEYEFSQLNCHFMSFRRSLRYYFAFELHPAFSVVA